MHLFTKTLESLNTLRIKKCDIITLQTYEVNSPKLNEKFTFILKKTLKDIKIPAMTWKVQLSVTCLNY